MVVTTGSAKWRCRWSSLRWRRCLNGTLYSGGGAACCVAIACPPALHQQRQLYSLELPTLLPRHGLWRRAPVHRPCCPSAFPHFPTQHRAYDVTRSVWCTLLAVSHSQHQYVALSINLLWMARMNYSERWALKVKQLLLDGERISVYKLHN